MTTRTSHSSMRRTCSNPLQPILRPRSFGRHSERGVALVIALVLMVVITLIGFAAVRGTIMQQKMASNLYDREVAFQNAEAAMRVAQQRILTHATDIARNCQAGGIVCLGNPFNDPNLDQDKIVTVPTGTSVGQYDAAGMSTGQPQFVIENMGQWPDPESDTGFNQSANASQYGAQGKSSTATYYRITARSGDSSTVENRAVVTLQAMVKQN